MRWDKHPNGVKSKRERVEAYLNCKKLVECAGFKEVEGEAWVTKELRTSE